jgi:hypothetical protein
MQAMYVDSRWKSYEGWAMKIDKLIEVIGLKMWFERNRPVLRYYILEMIIMVFVLAAIIALLFVF